MEVKSSSEGQESSRKGLERLCLRFVELFATLLGAVSECGGDFGNYDRRGSSQSDITFLWRLLEAQELGQ